jgi:hypothetical protein
MSVLARTLPTKEPTMDLSTLTPADSVEITLRHPATGVDLTTEKGDPITISIHGMDSAVFQAHQKGLINKRLQRQTRKAAVTAEQIEEESLGTLAACISGWKNIEFDGKSLEFSRSNAKLLLGKLRWVREQLDEAIGDRSNFLTGSATN